MGDRWVRDRRRRCVCVDRFVVAHRDTTAGRGLGARGGSMRLGFAIIAALLLADCSQASPPAPARMSIEFTWSDGAGPAFTYWMYASV